MKKQLLASASLSVAAALLLGASPALAAKSMSSSSGLGSAPYVSGDKDAPVTNADNITDAILGSKVFFDARNRYEYVDQTNLKNEAHADTLRTLAGFQTTPYKDVAFAFAAENVMPITPDHRYNDGVNGLSKYPKITDPSTTALQLGNAQWTGLPDTSVTVGRQYLILDNQRWVGVPDWRQLRQTFDAVTVKNGSIKDFEFLYSFVWDVNRTAGTRSSTGMYNTSTNLFHATYTGVPDLKLSPYVYLMDIDHQPSLSNQTEGLRGEWKHKLDDSLSATAAAEYARQSSYGNAITKYSLNYFTIEPGFIVGQDKGLFGSFTGKVGYESMGGNGVSSVQTPEAANHNQNGFADIFSTTPANGLVDEYLDGTIKYQLPWAVLSPTKFETTWHHFSSTHKDIHYGNELDLELGQTIATHYTVQLNYNVFHQDSNLYPTTHKFMLSAAVSF